jgi:hypothetical protein
VPTEATPSEDLPAPQEEKEPAKSDSAPADAMPPMPPMSKTTSRNTARAMNFVNAPVGPKSDGRVKQAVSSNAKQGGVKSAKFDWGTVDGDEASAPLPRSSKTSPKASAKPRNAATKPASRSNGNVLRQQSRATERDTESFADAPGPNATSAARSRSIADRSGA